MYTDDLTLEEMLESIEEYRHIVTGEIEDTLKILDELVEKKGPELTHQQRFFVEVNYEILASIINVKNEAIDSALERARRYFDNGDS